jgi:lysophospholipase L1-like esterase
MVPEIKPATTERVFTENNVYGDTFGLKPKSKGTSMGVIREVNIDRFWSHNSPQDTVKNWLILGDSVTMGIGVNQDSIYPGLLSFNQDTLRILNPSFIGYSSRDYLNILSNLDDRFKSNLSRVTVFWCLNDVYSNPVNTNSPKGISFLGNYITGFIYNRVFTYQWLKKNIFDRPKKYFLYDEQFYSEQNYQYQNSLENIFKIKTITDSLNLKLDVVILPYEYQLRANVDYPQKQMKNDLIDNQINVIDIFSSLKKITDDYEDIFLYGDGIHFSKKGHKIVYDIISKQLN